MTHFPNIKSGFFLLLLSFSLNIAAQNVVAKKNYALLWEITGKDLTKPSYLFGTMHLRDKRVFEFSDSMLLKLAACDAFASEVRMDSAVYQSFELAVAGDTTNRLSSKLSKKGYERLLQALKSKGIKMDSLASKNTALVQGWLTEREEDDKEDSKDLFLDLYLTRLAYTQGKSLHGLERMEEYEDMNDSFFKQFEDSTFFQKDTAFTSVFAHFALMEEMINVYNSGDLDNLLEIIKSEKSFNGTQHKREMLDNRNVRMLQKLEDLMRQKSVFCAVGAAHLPDTMGLIALLRQKGYTVRKVDAQFTGMAEQFKPKKVEREWYHLKDDFNHFELDFPEQPYLMNKLNANTRRLGVEYIYFDITTNALWLTEADYYPHIGQKKLSTEKQLNDLFASWIKARGFKDVQKEKITVGDTEGYRFSGRMKGRGLVKGQYFLANNNIYKTMVLFDKYNDKNTERADAYLKSLKINPLPLTDWQVFEEEKGAFSIKMPVKPDFQEVKSVIPTENGENLNYYANLFISKEAQEGFTYMVRYNDMPAGRYIDNDSFYMAQTRDASVERFKKLKANIEIDSTTRHYGCPEYNVKVTIEGVTMLMRNILRGNRSYLLLGQPPLAKNKANNKKLEDWMNSFQFLPLNVPKLTKTDLSQLDLRLGLPTSKELFNITENKGRFPTKKEITLNTTDNQTGIAYVVTKSEYSKYYSAINTDSFWQKYTRSLKALGSKEVNVAVSDTLFKGLKAKLVTLSYLKSQNVFKSIVFLKDGYQYELNLVLPYEIAATAYAHTYFDALEFLDKKEKKDIFSSKKQLVLNDLASSTDSIAKEAKAALEEMDWLREDLPLLTTALQKHYTFDSLEDKSTRLLLLNQITEFKDTATFSILEKLVGTTQKDSALHRAILCAFLHLDTLNSANRFFESARSAPFAFDNFYCLNEFMTDSVARAKLYYDKMLALSDKPYEEAMIVLISQRLADLDTLHLMRDVFARYTPQYLAAANALMTKNADMLKRDTLARGEYGAYNTFRNYIRLFKNIPNTLEINQFLRTIATTNQEDILSELVQTQAKIGQPIDKTHWAKLSKKKANWYSLLIDLKNDSLLSVVPPQYINQKDIAEGSILSSMQDEYDDPKEFSLLEIQKYKGEALYVYKCKMNFGEDENNYLITVCTQPSDRSKYNLEPTVLLFSEPLADVKTYKKVVEELLKGFEKREDKRD